MFLPPSKIRSSIHSRVRVATFPNYKGKVAGPTTQPSMTVTSEPETFKGDAEMVDVARTVTVEPLPAAIKAEGGLVVDTENLAATTGLKLSKDGHVCMLSKPDPAGSVHARLTSVPRL